MSFFNKRLGTVRLLVHLPMAFLSIFIYVFLLTSLILVTNLLVGKLLTWALFILLFISYEFYLRKTNNFYVYPITSNEYEEIKDRHLIHYTNSISDEDYQYFLQTGKIRLKAKISAKTNYVMKFKNKRKNYIWFHQEEQNMEPNFNSYYFSHMHENSPRKYKVIIRVSDLEKERMLVRPSNNNVIIMNDLEVPGIIYTKYNSYNTKFYLKKLIIGGLLGYIHPKVWLSSLHQTYGIVVDFLLKFYKRESKKKELNYKI